MIADENDIDDAIWRSFEAFFEPDGALTDIYALGTSLADWQAALNVLRVLQPPPTFFVGREAAPLPFFIGEVFRLRDQQGALLSLMIGQSLLNCHFFIEEEIEFDLDPATVNCADEFRKIVGFLLLLGRVTGKSVIITPEGGSVETSILRYIPQVDKLAFDN